MVRRRVRPSTWLLYPLIELALASRIYLDVISITDNSRYEEWLPRITPERCTWLLAHLASLIARHEELLGSKEYSETLSRHGHR